MNDASSALLYVVSGRVQGVGFRHFVWKMAIEIGIRGWVRNRTDGTVEVAAWGSDDQLDHLNNALHEGPRWSTVSAVRREMVPNSEDPVGRFSIRT